MIFLASTRSRFSECLSKAKRLFNAFLLMAVVLALAGMKTLSAAEEPPLAIAIAVAHRGKDRVIEYSAPNAHFHVLITNTSDEPLRIWQEWCSWGYFGLSFECSDAEGGKWTAKKLPRRWDKNYPDYWTLAAHESLVLDVSFADTRTWKGFRRPAGMSQEITMRAILEFQPEAESQKHSVWTGRAASKADTYLLYR